jgi:hypothetical protein
MASMSRSNMRCIHGLDSRFCAVCNRRSAFSAPRQAIGTVTLADVQKFLEEQNTRATRRAVADALGIAPTALKLADTSRIVETSREVDVISTGTELLMRMSASGQSAT